MSVQVSYKKQFVVGILLLIILLSVIEVFLRVYDYYQPNCVFMKSSLYSEIDVELQRSICLDNDDLKWEDYPFLHLIPNQHLTTINVNEYGFRGNEISIQKPENTYRIFIVGGSTTFGVGATSDSETIPGYLQNIYDSSTSDFKVQVINAGIPKGYSFTETYLIKNQILDFDPDLIIVYDGWNDISRSYDAFEEDIDSKLTDKILRAFQKNDFYKTGKILQKIYFNWRNSGDSAISKFDDADIDKKVSYWKTQWSEICELGKKNGFDVIVTLQPLVGTGNKKLTEEEMKYYKRYDHVALVSNYQAYAEALHDLEHGCTKVADLRGSFDDVSTTLFFDSGHTSNEGNFIVANKLYELSSSTVQIQK